MKFTTSSVLKAATSAAAILLTLSASQVSALPAPNLAKRSNSDDLAGLNNYGCKLTAAHPRPVVLIHGTTLSINSWTDFVPVMVKRGYCVFGLTYGIYPPLTSFGGLAPIEDSAREVGNFINDVLAKMNVTQVDVVGHSQGGIIARYWMRYLDGAGKVHTHVGVSGINHGTTLDGIATLGKVLGIFNSVQPLFDSVAPSLFEMVTNSPFMNKLNEGSDIVPGVTFANIATKLDEIVTPYENCYQNDTGVTNALLQDFCSVDLTEHIFMPGSSVVLQFVLNQLSPSTAVRPNCFSGLIL
ncbi:hypothetical protein BGZ79_003367 [Entomortierella chlamydospora]|nr:hypothetical protein BGZ79_003367 [Entomortierella chlamydospora]